VTSSAPSRAIPMVGRTNRGPTSDSGSARVESARRLGRSALPGLDSPSSRACAGPGGTGPGGRRGPSIPPAHRPADRGPARVIERGRSSLRAYGATTGGCEEQCAGRARARRREGWCSMPARSGRRTAALRAARCPVVLTDGLLGRSAPNAQDQRSRTERPCARRRRASAPGRDLAARRRSDRARGGS